MATNILVQEAHTIPPTSPSSLRSFFRLHPLMNFPWSVPASIKKYPLRLLLFSCKLLLFPTFFLLFHIRTSYFFLLFHQGRVESLYIAHVYSLWQDLSYGTIIFYHVTLTLKFDLLLTNFNLGHNFLTRRGRAFILHMCIPCDKTFHIVP